MTSLSVYKSQFDSIKDETVVGSVLRIKCRSVFYIANLFLALLPLRAPQTVTLTLSLVSTSRYPRMTDCMCYCWFSFINNEIKCLFGYLFLIILSLRYLLFSRNYSIKYRLKFYVVTIRALEKILFFLIMMEPGRWSWEADSGIQIKPWTAVINHLFLNAELFIIHNFSVNFRLVELCVSLLHWHINSIKHKI